MSAPKKTEGVARDGHTPKTKQAARLQPPALSGGATPRANFDARTVPKAEGSTKHGAEPFTWGDLCAVVADPVDLGSIAGKDPAEVKKSKLRAFCRPCVGRVRKNAVVEALGYLVVDVDGGDYAAALAALRRAKLRAVLYTTPSHRLPGKGNRDRFRVVVAVRAPQADPACIGGATAYLVAGVLGLPVDAVDACSFDPGRLMYLPGVFDENAEHYRHDVLTGKSFDAETAAEMADVEGYAPPKAKRQAPTGHDDIDAATLRACMAVDPFAVWLAEHLGADPRRPELSGNFVKLPCPWRHEHTDGNEDAFFIPRIGGRGGVFKCHHDHCRDRKLIDLQLWARDEGCPYVLLRLDNLCFMADAAKFVDIGTMHVYPAEGVDALVPVSEWPWAGEGDHRKRVRPSVVLKRNERGQWFDTMVYDPDEPPVIEDRMIVENADAYRPTPGARMLNTYHKPASFEGGDEGKAGLWLQLLRGLYGSEPGEVEHVLRWMASAVRYPGRKINHALVLCGAQGIGKDSLLHPLEALLGHANIRSIAADTVFSQFDTYRAGVLLKVNEIRPTDSRTLTALYEKLKETIAAPPAMLSINGKHAPLRYIRNLVKVVLTTNHPDALHIPPDDRRLFVLDTDTPQGWKSQTWFLRYYQWCAREGIAHVKAYLETIDLQGFDPSAPPPKTRAWKACVENRRAVGGDDACAVAIETLTDANGGEPPRVVFGRDLVGAIEFDGDDHTRDTRLTTLRKRPQAMRKLMLDLGYTAMPNPHSARGWLYKRRGTRVNVVLGLAWVRQGVSAAEVDRECRKRQKDSD